MHFHEGESVADTHPRAFAKRDVSETVPPGFLCRRKTLWLKLLWRRPKIWMPMDNVLTDHHDGILRDGIADKLVCGIGLAREHHRGRIETQGFIQHHAAVGEVRQVVQCGRRSEERRVGKEWKGR